MGSSDNNRADKAVKLETADLQENGYKITKDGQGIYRITKDGEPKPVHLDDLDNYEFIDVAEEAAGATAAGVVADAVEGDVVADVAATVAVGAGITSVLSG